MAIPDYQSIMLPLLQFSGDKKEHSFREAVEVLAKKFDLSKEERKELLPSGTQPIFDNRVGWASTYLKKANILESRKRGFFNITDRGLEVLKNKPDYINVNFLRQYPEFLEFKSKKSEVGTGTDMGQVEFKTPEEDLEYGYQKIRQELAQELLKNIKDRSPNLFEKLVVDLLVNMGYGGSRKDAGRAIGKTSDDGIDGIIKEDKLGLDVIYIQAKRWENTVGRPEIQKFAGALQGKRARKGVFIKTSNFSKNALEYVSTIDSKIVLIDGEKLTQYMIDHDIGVSKVASYEIKKMDSDYFTED